MPTHSLQSTTHTKARPDLLIWTPVAIGIVAICVLGLAAGLIPALIATSFFATITLMAVRIHEVRSLPTQSVMYVKADVAQSWEIMLGALNNLNGNALVSLDRKKGKVVMETRRGAAEINVCVTQPGESSIAIRTLAPNHLLKHLFRDNMFFLQVEANLAEAVLQANASAK